jgi:hypothetical protein
MPKRKAAAADGGAVAADDKGSSSKKKSKAAKEADAVPPAAQKGKAASSSIPVDAALIESGKLHGTVTVHQDYAYLANQAREVCLCASVGASVRACVRKGASTNMFVRCLRRFELAAQTGFEPMA